MKTSLLFTLCAAAPLLLLSSCATGGSSTSHQPTEAPMTPSKHPEQKQVMTGSHIPQTITGGRTETVAGSPLRVISREELDRYAGDTLAQNLRRYPDITILGY